jgi:hypothetical protein
MSKASQLSGTPRPASWNTALLRQYLYFCISKASKLSKARKKSSSPPDADKPEDKACQQLVKHVSSICDPPRCY